MRKMDIYKILAVIALFLAGISLGMNIWALVFALKGLPWDKRKDSSNRSDGADNKR